MCAPNLWWRVLDYNSRMPIPLSACTIMSSPYMQLWPVQHPSTQILLLHTYHMCLASNAGIFSRSKRRFSGHWRYVPYVCQLISERPCWRLLFVCFSLQECLYRPMKEERNFIWLHGIVEEWVLLKSHLIIFQVSNTDLLSVRLVTVGIVMKELFLSEMHKVPLYRHLYVLLHCHTAYI